MYNENEVRDILKFDELTERDKKKRYKALFVLPSIAILFLLFSENFNYIFMSFVVVAFMLIELIIFGLMDTKYHYALSDFLKDGLYLILSSFIITYAAAPIVLKLFTRQMNLSDFALNGLKFFVAMLLLYGTWFSIVLIQSKIRKRSERWKWDVTGFVSGDKKKI
ncbi:hypothetical protein [Alkalibacterium sp. 20]|uniref:hypothetical protein n=1 Tax=Alkalibacterium sp. 20 TaxID=1798803 RepID=UPI0009001769|nr:hypothetical protein [Alkalibacterium sp. 20]OJF93267.1 hypothetical protein AX762_09155 [Alkalibacterium sp. 20]